MVGWLIRLFVVLAIVVVFGRRIWWFKTVGLYLCYDCCVFVVVCSGWCLGSGFIWLVVCLVVVLLLYLLIVL